MTILLSFEKILKITKIRHFVTHEEVKEILKLELENELGQSFETPTMTTIKGHYYSLGLLWEYLMVVGLG